MGTLLFISLTLFLSFSSSFALSSSETVFNAAEMLSNSGYVAMALTFQLISKTLPLNSSPLIIFAPSDTAFVRSGQPPLLLLQYHISPIRLSIESLKKLPSGTTVPTLLSNQSLVITSSRFDGQLSINNVKVNESAIFDDGSLVIYGTDEFFNSSFAKSWSFLPELCPTLITGAVSPSDPFGHESSGVGDDSPASVSHLLRSRGYWKMATFLELQLVGFTDNTKLTIFAPVDEVIDKQVKNFSDYSSLFQRHVVPSLMRWMDLGRLDSRIMLQTFSEGFVISVARSGDVLVLNDVPIIFPDMYYSDRIVVHGLNQLLDSPAQHEVMGDSFSALDGYDDENPPDYGEF